MFDKRFIIIATAFAAFLAWFAFGGVSPSSEAVVKVLGVAILIGVIYWFMVWKPWK